MPNGMDKEIPKEDQAELGDLLKKFYKPDQGSNKLDNFESFFASIEEQLTNSKASDSISEANKRIQRDLLKREEKLSFHKQQVDKFANFKPSNFKPSKKLFSLSIGLFILLIALALVYFGLQHFQ